MFSTAAIEQLGYYVYFLKDPKTGKVFYVGKGTGNRIFNHLEWGIDIDGKTEKLEKIREIINSGQKVQHFILRHGLTEETAFEIEASLIDFIGKENLLNIQGGHYSNDYGLKTTEEISAMYEAEELATAEPIMLINLNKEYRRDMTESELYKATQKRWVVGRRREKAKYAVATYRGLTREVYQIKEWYPAPKDGKTRWGFNGVTANNHVRDKLRYKSIASFFRKGAANPIRYVNC